ncbi:ABC transporter substrate-binding protein [Pseudonocardia kujensis]|uniref:ABC transporter substrate-binding protein n=1 Tax=Pseudonocardia kujensis TaxID=1128675 RepID=UPI001E5335D2|nr:ABC transporter substrate-binding protein [Pseudonocardia kujensis]MCE0762501.1 ABC transporter substrate-binding protein [Pseudonocardia kujensis]
MPKPRALMATVSVAAAVALLISGCGSGSSTPTAGDSTTSQVIPELYDRLPQQVRDSGVLTVATDPSYPPCDYTDDSGEIAGFNHDLLMAMAPRLGVKITQEAIAFDGLLPGVQSGRYTAAMECITDNAERQKTVQFVDYAYATLSLMATAANPKTITSNPLSVCGLHVGVQIGTEFVDNARMFSENCVAQGRPELEVTNFPTAGAQNTALQSGQIDFAVTDTATGAWQNKTSNNAFTIIPSPMLARTYVGIVVPRDADDTAQALLGALQAIIKDGTYDQIMSQWGLSDAALKEPGINLAATRPLELPTRCGACGQP